MKVDSTVMSAFFKCSSFSNSSAFLWFLDTICDKNPASPEKDGSALIRNDVKPIVSQLVQINRVRTKHIIQIGIVFFVQVENIHVRLNCSLRSFLENESQDNGGKPMERSLPGKRRAKVIQP